MPARIVLGASCGCDAVDCDVSKRRSLLGLAPAPAAQGIAADFVGSDELDCPEVRSIAALRFLNLRPTRTKTPRVHSEAMKRQPIEQFPVAGSRVTVVPFGISDTIPDTGDDPGGSTAADGSAAHRPRARANPPDCRR
jgi:hypothetical protein